MQRQSDDLFYTFHRKSLPDGSIGYQREDADLWIRFRPGFGWGVWDGDGKTLLGRPWDVPPSEQNMEYPPTGEWVSRKGPKSYVYNLIYI
ncbi:MAG: hypothetical protein QM636_18380 [Rhizobium sp.]